MDLPPPLYPPLPLSLLSPLRRGTELAGRLSDIIVYIVQRYLGGASYGSYRKDTISGIITSKLDNGITVRLLLR